MCLPERLLPLPGRICREADAKLHLSLPMEHERDETPADAPCFQCPTGPGLSHRGLLEASSPEGGPLLRHPPHPLHPGGAQGSAIWRWAS